MKASYQFARPGSIEATIALTMSVDNWRELRKALEGAAFHGPVQTLRSAIDALTRKAEAAIAYDSQEAQS